MKDLALAKGGFSGIDLYPMVTTNHPETARFVNGIYALKNNDYKGLMGENTSVRWIMGDEFCM